MEIGIQTRGNGCMKGWEWRHVKFSSSGKDDQIMVWLFRKMRLFPSLLSSLGVTLGSRGAWPCCDCSLSCLAYSKRSWGEGGGGGGGGGGGRGEGRRGRSWRERERGGKEGEELEGEGEGREGGGGVGEAE